MEPPRFHFHRSTARGRGGIALFELYSPQAGEILRAVFRPRCGAMPDSGRASLGDVLDGGGEPLDEALAAHVPAAGMWSRIEAWTLSVHGGPWIQERLEESLAKRGGCPLDTRGVLRLARDAGAVDAVQASAYELLVGALTEKAARFFVRQWNGELTTRLREVLALAADGKSAEALLALEELNVSTEPAFRLGHPLRVLLAGRPNAGKSTLFNRLVEDERAAVTSLPGTTRDTLEELIAIDGFPVLVADTAGIRPLEDIGEVEAKGIRKVLEAVQSGRADGVLYLVAPPWRLSAEDHGFLSRLSRERCLVVAAKMDLGSSGAASGLSPDLQLSAKTGAGLKALRALILERWLRHCLPPEAEIPCAPFTARQRMLLSSAACDLAAGGREELDAVRQASIICLESSWPEGEVPLSAAGLEPR